MATKTIKASAAVAINNEVDAATEEAYLRGAIARQHIANATASAREATKNSTAKACAFVSGLLGFGEPEAPAAKVAHVDKRAELAAKLAALRAKK